jgi:hypothetical protein
MQVWVSFNYSDLKLNKLLIFIEITSNGLGHRTLFVSKFNFRLRVQFWETHSKNENSYIKIECRDKIIYKIVDQSFHKATNDSLQIKLNRIVEKI